MPPVLKTHMLNKLPLMPLKWHLHLEKRYDWLRCVLCAMKVWIEDSNIVFMRIDNEVQYDWLALVCNVIIMSCHGN